MLDDLLFGPGGLFETMPPPDWWEHDPDLRAPFPWFGGKSKVAHIVWERFGEVKNFVEPFLGSGAVMLARPDAPIIETANDFDAMVCNFYRAVQSDPESVAAHCDWPVMELDLHSRHKYLVRSKAVLKARLDADPFYFNALIAGWWVWGLCAWIGDGWCTSSGVTKNGQVQKRTPFLAGSKGHAVERGVHAKRMRQGIPDLGGRYAKANSYGRGVHSGSARGLSQRLPAISGNGHGGGGLSGVHGKETRSNLVEIMLAIAQRIRYVRFTCGDFERILSPALTWKHGLTGVFLDPPYPGDAGSTGGIYSTEAHERETFDRAFRYCVANGANKDLRIALCYYEGTTVLAPDHNGITFDGPAENVSDKLRSLGWSIVEWKADGGYGGQSGKNENRHRERIAFSPHCLNARQATLF